VNTTCTFQSYLKLLAALKQFQQLISRTENKTSRARFLLNYQPS